VPIAVTFLLVHGVVCCGPCSKDDIIDVPVERKTVVIPSHKAQTRYLLWHC